MDIATKTQRECEQRVAEEYLSSLSDLNCNSKPLINMLTMLAEENIEYAAVIVKVVEQHIAKVPPEFKLPILYLIDSIVKNVKSTYVQLFSQCIVNLFCGVFEKVNEKIRERMYALRQTWNEVFAAQKLYALDVKVKRLDNNWPITAKQPSIHVNPIFLKTASQAIPTEMEKILQDKTRELLELKKRKLELELEATMKHLEEQEKQICKTTDGVLPPVEALVAANVALQNVGMQPRHLPPQVIAGVMPPGFVGSQTMAVNSLRPPAMFHHNIRGFRPNMNPGIINDQLGPSLATPNNAVANNVANRPRVHPVNSALISSLRQRDPRLIRQQQQQLQSSKFSNATTNSNTPHSNQQQQMSGSSKSGRHERNSHRSSRKSPTRSSASSNSSNNRSSQRSNKSSSREKDRDRKQRSDSKSYSSSPSSLGSCLERSKKTTTSSGKVSERHHSSNKCDKDAFEIVPLSSAFKRKSTSPSSSPGKMRDSKRSNKSRSSRSKTASRSPSPHSEKLKDVDLRVTTASSSSPIIGSPDKRPKIIGDTDQETSRCDEQLPTVESVKHATNIDKKIENIVNFRKFPLASPLMQTSGKMDIDLRPHLVVPSLIATSATLPMPLTCNQRSIDLKPVFSAASDKMTSFVRNTEDLSSPTDARNVAISSSPKVSFKIQKNFNKLEKSTENLLSAGPLTSSSSESKIPLYPLVTLKAENSNSIDVKDEKPDDLNNLVDSVSKDQEDDGKKRSLAPVKDEEPMAKKSKSAKLDNLFGSEDVDLRQMMPPIPSNSQEDSVPPPPPFNVSNESNANWNNVKGDNTTDPLVKKSSLEDVRAKLAKTAKLNKLLKSDKEASDQRNEWAELHMNEDTQEANDEKIRTMITQAQELLEANSINQEQYKNLVKTVMSINEVNKLKEAQRRESLNALKEKLHDDGSPDSERNAARDAILKKRIPKLSKSQVVPNDQQTTSVSDTLSGEGSNSGGNMDDEKPDSNDETQLRSSRRDKRGPKPTKWGDRAVESPPNVMLPMGQMQQRPWNPMMGPQNKRGCGPVFRPIAPPPGIRTPWQMANNNTIQQFAKGVVPAGAHSRNNPIPSAVAPVQMAQQMIPKPCNSIDNPQEDIVRTITIDGAAKEIRFYDDVAIVFMEVDQPREIGFQNGQRTIYIDNHEPINLQFNNEYKTVAFDGETFKLRFGYPSRELYIDENWYEIYFGGPAIAVPIRNKIHMLKAEGPPPQVNIGPLRRDLVVGKINMIVDAHNVVPLFLDARPQTFKLGGEVHTIQFADNLLTVLLDGATTRVEYGGLPKSLFLGGKKYFIRFGALPQGVVAGNVQIKDMLYVETSPPAEPESPNLAVNTATTNIQNTHTVTSADINAVESQKQTQTSLPILPAAALSNINIDELFQKLVSTGILGGSSGILPAVNNTTTTQQSVATEAKSPDIKAAVDENASPPPDQLETIKPINLTKPESIKTRQAAIIATLYAGMQCSSCGVRFPPEQTIKYSQHLDWHFRQNRRERDTSRKAHARKWYFDFNDWIQYEEVEDVDEREKNFYDSQQNDPEIIDDTSNQRSTNSPVPSCRAGSDEVDRGCDMCQEKFEHFYNEEHEEWHLRGAMRIEDKIYHPLCYEDYKLSLTQPNAKSTKDVTIKEDVAECSAIQIDDDNAVDILIKPEEAATNNKEEKIEDEDDDVIVLPNEEPSVTEIYDDDDDGDDEYVPANVTREQMGNLNDDEEAGDLHETNESDVEIQEPHIPFTDLDTYVEKEFPTDGESTKHMFMKVKIKEEPKEDEDDEDDGFEDVGTVLIAPDEISINSSEDTQTQVIDSSVSAMSPLVERPASATPSIQNEDTQTSTMETPAIDLNISMDGNLETGDEHNLSAAGPVSTVPLASLVNKIKINITKNTVTTSSTASSSNSGAALSANTCISNNLGSLSDQSKSSAANPISTISTIPVLCGGATTISSTQSSSMGGILYEDPSAVQSHVGDGSGDDNSVSTISVIGSIYGDNGSATVSRSLPPAASKVTSKPASPTPPPVEDSITYELKAELQNVALKKKDKVICGNETSGLCSIM